MVKNEKRDNKYLVIGHDYNNGGIFAIFASVVSYIIWAERNGYTPIVDLQHHYNQYFKDCRVYLDNAWEYFFTQPTEYNLKSIQDGMNISISLSQFMPYEDSMFIPSDIPNSKNEVCKNKNAQDYQKYLTFNKDFEAKLTQKYEEIIGDKSNILGVLCRGTDYVSKKPYGHNIQPDVETVIKKVKEVIEEQKVEYIWVATESLEIYNRFVENFGDLVIPNPQYKYEETKDKYLYEIPVNDGNHSYNLGCDYILSMYILSKCKYFIGGKTYGTMGAYLMSDMFKNQQYVYLFDCGFYGDITYNNIFEKIFSIKKIVTDKNTRIALTVFGIKFIRTKNNMETCRRN